MTLQRQGSKICCPHCSRSWDLTKGLKEGDSCPYLGCSSNAQRGIGIRTAFLARTPKGSAGRATDEVIIEQFDKAGLGKHPDVLAMLNAIVTSESMSAIRAAKAKAYKLLEKVTDEENAKLAQQMKAVMHQQQDARLFFQELLDSVDTLGGIAEQHGSRTLADLMYLQNAILSGGFIDHYPGESMVLEIARDLPSGELWSKFIKVEHMLEPN